MSSIKKVLCLNVKDTCPKERIFTPGIAYDVVAESLMTFATGNGLIVNDNIGRPTTIIIGDDANCVYGEWQPLEGYMCMTHTLHHESNIGDILYGYAKNGVINFPHEGKIVCNMPGLFKKLSEMSSEPKPRYGVRHVVYDYNTDKVVDDAMGECYITLAEAQEVCDEMNAPKVMKTRHTKEVEYFGMKVLVPDDAKFIATTSMGSVLSCDSAMYQRGNEWSSDLSMISIIGFADLNGIDWRDTLVEIK